MRKNKLKAFTLVEVIVVMVIIALLAGLMTPSLTKYIDKADSMQTITNARTFYVAAQAALSEQYAINHDKLSKTCGEFVDIETGTRVGRMSNGSFYNYVNSNYYKNPTSTTQVIGNYNMYMCSKVLYYLQSDNKDSAAITFTSKNLPAGKKPSEYYKTTANQGQPMMALYYDSHGKIVLLEYADESLYKVTMRSGKLTVEKDGAFMKEKK